MKKFAVIGNPIEHSKSPEIHAAFAQQCGIDIEYVRLLADREQFAPTAKDFFARGAGANVTVPFKEDALRFADELSEAARLAGAVNTLSLRSDGAIVGDSTDGIGLVRDIRDNHGCSFTGKKILIVGAGGAARGVILPIARENPESLTIVNRTQAKARQLAEHFSAYTEMLSASFESLDSAFDIIINATSASLSGGALPLPEAVFSSQSFAYDMMYAATPTLFMQLAQQRGGSCADGLGMLVEQAAESFFLWHDVRPHTPAVIQRIRRQLQN